jgi:hypothetical protein
MGADFTTAAKVCARYRAGIRITNEGPDYRQNVAMTRWISAACRHYGAWLGIEPASLQIAASTVVHRIYNAVTSGAQELFCYPSALVNRSGYTVLAENLRYLRRERPVLSIAYWIPRNHLLGVGDVDYLGPMMALRRVTDFDAVDGVMIADGALRRYRALVMGHGHMEEEGVLRAIERWVREGGILIRPGGSPLTTLSGSSVFQARLFGEETGGADARVLRLGRGYTLRFASGAPADFGAAVAGLLRRAEKLTGALLSPVPRDLPDGVFGARLERAYLFLNTSSETKTVTVDGAGAGPGERPETVTIPPNSIRRVEARQRAHSSSISAQRRRSCRRLSSCASL